MNYTIQEMALLSRLKRWQNLPTVQQESVAEHTAQVALIVLKLSDYLAFDVGKALKIAVLHDLAEVDLTDLPHNVTRRFPKLAQAKREAETEVIAEKLPDYQLLLTEQSLEAKVVKLADTIQVCQFAKSELDLCQSRAMATVLAEATELARRFAIELDLRQNVLSWTVGN